MRTSKTVFKRLLLAKRKNRNRKTMTNTIENKQRFFALYFGQEVLIDDNLWKHKVLGDTMYWDDCHLELKSLSDISDDDAIEVAKMASNKVGNKKYKYTISEKRQNYITVNCGDWLFQISYKCEFEGQFYGYSINEYGKSVFTTTYNIHNITDYLRKRGYLIPFDDLTIEQILAYKWAVIK